jgi:hypothetical protein
MPAAHIDKHKVGMEKLLKNQTLSDGEESEYYDEAEDHVNNKATPIREATISEEYEDST